MKFLLCPLEELFSSPAFFSEMVNTDFHNQVTRIDNERASPTYTHGPAYFKDAGP